MLFLVHLESVGRVVATSAMQIGRIAIEERIGAVVEPDNVNGRAVLNLDAKEPLCDLGECFDASEPL